MRLEQGYGNILLIILDFVSRLAGSHLQFFKPLKVIGSPTIEEDGLSSCMEKLAANKPSCFFCQLGRMLRRESEAGPLRSRAAESMGQRVNYQQWRE